MSESQTFAANSSDAAAASTVSDAVPSFNPTPAQCASGSESSAGDDYQSSIWETIGRQFANP
ncbi:hypothetical protein GCM10009644_11080 [Microbacterium oxydans]